jgi:hypothetical protein
MSRYIEIVGQHRERYVVDMRSGNVLCKCEGFNGPTHSALIREALNAHHQELYDALGVPVEDNANLT